MIVRRFVITCALLGIFSFTSPAHSADTATATAPATTNPAPRPGKWIDRHNLINGRAKEGKVDLIFIGDSITQGWEGAGKEVWAKFYGKRNAMNAGIGGDRTEHVLWRLENGNIDGIKPKLAVVMIGTNNSGSNTSEDIATGITAIVKKLRTSLPETKVLLLSIFPRGAGPTDAKRKVNEGANAIIAKLADNKDVFVMDIGSKLSNADGTLSKDVMPDLLHLSPKGYTQWAEAIEAKVAELLGESKGS